MRVFLTIFSFFFSFSVFAQGIATLNYVKLENQSKVSKNIAEQIQERQKKLEIEVSDIQKTVQKKVEELEKARSVLTGKALEQKRESLQKELMKMEENLKKKAQKLEEIKNEALITVNEKIKSISAEIAKEKNYDAVIAEAGVVYAKPELDITDDVLKELDKKLPKLKINWDRKS